MSSVHKCHNCGIILHECCSIYEEYEDEHGNIVYLCISCAEENDKISG